MIIAREFNPFTQVEITYERDSMNPRLLHIHQKQRCDGTLEAVGRLRQRDKVETGAGRLMGVIPPGLALQWGREHGVNVFRLPGRERVDFFKRKLNDRDYSKLRVTEGSF